MIGHPGSMWCVHWVSLLIALAALFGCTVWPHYQPPILKDGAQAPLVSLTPTAETAAQPPDAWWQLYHDALLDQFLQEAFTANTDLKIAEANLSAARAILEGVRAARYPDTKLEAGGTYGRDPITDEILELGGHRPANTWIFAALLDVSYEVDLFGHVRRSIEASRADAAANAAARDAVKITVAAETARAYAQICALGEQISVARHSLEVVGREADITIKANEERPCSNSVRCSAGPLRTPRRRRRPVFGRRVWMPSSPWATASNSSGAARTFAKQSDA